MSYGTSVEGTTIVVQVTPISGYNYYQIYWRKTSESANEESGWGLASEFSEYEITGLEQGESYYVNVGYNNTGSGGADGFMGRSNAITIPYIRPDNWYWSASVTQDGAVTTESDGSGGYLAKFITATRWNAFCDRVAAFEKYTLHTSSSYASCKVVAGDPMLASTANAIRSKIAALNPPTSLPSAVDSGDIIRASFILGLAASLNSIS